MATREPSAVAANAAIRIAGGQIIRSTSARTRPHPRRMPSSCTTEALRPCIFQLPAISGRRLGICVFPSSARWQSCERLAERQAARKSPKGSVAGCDLDPYDAPPCGTRLCGRPLSPDRRIMLRGIHKASGHWLGKLVMAGLFGFLALSFAVWGIGDIFRGFGRSSLAKIGSTEIGIEQFRHAYNEHLQQLGRKLGRPITPDQSRALCLERHLLCQLMLAASVDERARQLGLNLS